MTCSQACSKSHCGSFRAVNCCLLARAQEAADAVDLAEPRDPPGVRRYGGCRDQFRLPAVRPDPDGLSEPGRPTQVAAAALADDEG
jgi:hypothetical protein